MKPVQRQEIIDYLTYDDQRKALRSRILEIKAARRVHLGEHLTFLFENHETIRYQIQEMMRTEKLVRETQILHELATYNELLGGPGELGCTLLIEIEKAEDRDNYLRQWRHLMEHLYVILEDGSRAPARFDPRQVGDERLSSVQYLKFDTKGQIPVAVATDLPALAGECRLSEVQRKALAEDMAS